MAWTVRTRMTKFYQRHQVSDTLLHRLEEFIEKNLACATCDLQGQLQLKQQNQQPVVDMENAGHLLFSFVELDQLSEQD